MRRSVQQLCPKKQDELPNPGHPFLQRTDMRCFLPLIQHVRKACNIGGKRKSHANVKQRIDGQGAFNCGNLRRIGKTALQQLRVGRRFAYRQLSRTSNRENCKFQITPKPSTIATQCFNQMLENSLACTNHRIKICICTAFANFAKQISLRLHSHAVSP